MAEFAPQVEPQKFQIPTSRFVNPTVVYQKQPNYSGVMNFGDIAQGISRIARLGLDFYKFFEGQDEKEQQRRLDAISRAVELYRDAKTPEEQQAVGNLLRTMYPNLDPNIWEKAQAYGQFLPQTKVRQFLDTTTRLGEETEAIRDASMRVPPVDQPQKGGEVTPPTLQPLNMEDIKAGVKSTESNIQAEQQAIQSGYTVLPPYNFGPAVQAIQQNRPTSNILQTTQPAPQQQEQKGSKEEETKKATEEEQASPFTPPPEQSQEMEVRIEPVQPKEGEQKIEQEEVPLSEADAIERTRRETGLPVTGYAAADTPGINSGVNLSVGVVEDPNVTGGKPTSDQRFAMQVKYQSELPEDYYERKVMADREVAYHMKTYAGLLAKASILLGRPEIATSESVQTILSTTTSEFRRMRGALLEKMGTLPDEMYRHDSPYIPLVIATVRMAMSSPDYQETLKKTPSPEKGKNMYDYIMGVYGSLPPHLVRMYWKPAGDMISSSMSIADMQKGLLQMINYAHGNQIKADEIRHKVAYERAKLMVDQIKSISESEKAMILKQLDITSEEGKFFWGKWEDIGTKLSERASELITNQSQVYENIIKLAGEQKDAQSKALLNLIGKALPMAGILFKNAGYNQTASLLNQEVGTQLSNLISNPYAYTEADAETVKQAMQVRDMVLEGLENFLQQYGVRWHKITAPDAKTNNAFKMSRYGTGRFEYFDPKANKWVPVIGKDGRFRIPVAVTVTVPNYRPDGTRDMKNPYTFKKYTIGSISELPSLSDKIAKDMGFEYTLMNDPVYNSLARQSRQLFDMALRHGIKLEPLADERVERFISTLVDKKFIDYAHQKNKSAYLSYNLFYKQMKDRFPGLTDPEIVYAYTAIYRPWYASTISKLTGKKKGEKK